VSLLVRAGVAVWFGIVSSDAHRRPCQHTAQLAGRRSAGAACGLEVTLTEDESEYLGHRDEQVSWNELL
jgi:hypothetical protein